MNRQLVKNEQSLQFASAKVSEIVTVIDSDRKRSCNGLTLFLNISKDSEDAIVFTADASSDVCTSIGHNLALGRKLAASSDGTLPGGLSATNYYAIPIDSDTFKLASSLQNALDNVAVDITGAGTGTHSLTPAALSGLTWQSFVSPDASGENWISQAAAHDINSATEAISVDSSVHYRRLKVKYSITAGQVSIVQTISADQDVLPL